MSRVKYYYDTQTCKYERIKVSKWDVILNALGFISLSLIFAVGIIMAYNAYYESPQEARLKKENEELKFYYDILKEDMKRVDKMLTALQNRDDNVYRTIFEAEPIPSTIRNAGIGGTERYKNLLESGLEKEELIVKTFKKIDKLKRQMYIQTKSYDEILNLANDKADMLASIPAIQPIHNKKLKRLASGYGMRIHPIYKVKMMHTGVDFSAARGTPIYATGKGKVIKARKRSLGGGYGKYVEISHGYGYKSKYGHMREIIVDAGDMVQRGDLIGYVGNSGLSTAPHVHYEVIKDNKTVNPVHYFYQDLNAEDYEKLLKLASIENQSLS